MAMGFSVQALIDEIGHDGSEILWPDLPEPHCRRGFIPHEFIHIGMKLDMLIVTFQKSPRVGHDMEHSYVAMSHIKLYDYIVTGKRYVLHRPHHTVACDGRHIFCPTRGKLPLTYDDRFTHLYLVT